MRGRALDCDGLIRLGAWAAVLVLGAMASCAVAQEPAASLSIRETVDLWDNVRGGVRTGAVVLDKLQISATLSGERFGLRGVSVHAQLFRTDGASLSARLGDIQTASNIEAVPATRLFESWIDKKFGDKDRSFAVRAGLMDLNSDFDSLAPSSLMINSSHGIGPDLSRSGLNGPSIFPVSALGARLSWMPSKAWTFRIAAFDGVPGDPDRPKEFVNFRLRRKDGALTIVQADYRLGDDAKVEAGAWRYSASTPAPFHGHDEGGYASISGPLPGLKGLSGWFRAGVADRGAQIVDSYLGAGLVAKGLVPGRADDQIGFAVARAGIGQTAAGERLRGRAETNFEASYQVAVREMLALQPDLQFVHHPSGIPGARDALVLGIRMVLTGGFPRRAKASEAADPTVPPDGAQPADPGQQP